MQEELQALLWLSILAHPKYESCFCIHNAFLLQFLGSSDIYGLKNQKHSWRNVDASM